MEQRGAVWRTEETFKFIELYRQEPCIWNRNDSEHKNKVKVNDAWMRISNSMGIPVEELKKKKESLMTLFRLHLKKKKASLINGGDEMYRPMWMFYDSLEAFLKDVYDCPHVNTEEDVPLYLKEDRDTFSDDGPSCETPPVTNKKRLRRRKNSKLQEVLPNIDTVFSSPNDMLSIKYPDGDTDDECELYGKLIAKRLRQFSDLERDELMYEISGLILKKRKTNHQATYYSHISSSDMISPSKSAVPSLGPPSCGTNL